MRQHEYHLRNIEWAKSMLARPAADLPGTLTHAKCAAVLEDSLDALLPFARYSACESGLLFSHYES